MRGPRRHESLREASAAQARPTAQHHLADLADLVDTGPLELGAFTQAEMAVVLGGVPALAGVGDEALAEAVRSLAARGVLHRVPGQQQAEVVGDLGLLVALNAFSVGTLEIRRGHPSPANADWRWIVSLYGYQVVGVDQIDALGLHRLSLVSVGMVADELASRMCEGRAKVGSGAEAPVAIPDDEVRRLAQHAPRRWQLIHHVPRKDGPGLTVDALVLRIDDDRVDLITRSPETEGYQRSTVDSHTLAQFMRGLFALT